MIALWHWDTPKLYFALVDVLNETMIIAMAMTTTIYQNNQIQVTRIIIKKNRKKKYGDIDKNKKISCYF